MCRCSTTTLHEITSSCTSKNDITKQQQIETTQNKGVKRIEWKNKSCTCLSQNYIFKVPFLLYFFSLFNSLQKKLALSITDKSKIRHFSLISIVIRRNCNLFYATSFVWRVKRTLVSAFNDNCGGRE